MPFTNCLLEDIYSKELSNENKKKELDNIFKYILLVNKFEFADNKIKNQIFLKRFDFIDIQDAIYWLHENVDLFEIEEGGYSYEYINGNHDKTYDYIKSLSNEDRKKQHMNLFFYLSPKNDILDKRDSNLKSKGSQKLYISFKYENRKKPLLFSFHNINKNSFLQNKDRLLQIHENVVRDDIIFENLSFSQLKNKMLMGMNDYHLNKFYKQRTSLQGLGTSTLKLIASNLNDKGEAEFLFRSYATVTNNDKFKVDVNKDFKLIPNYQHEYDVELKICDFWDKIENLDLQDKNDFTKKDMVALIDLSENIKLFCDCPSFHWMGSNYNLSVNSASLHPTTIAPQFWNRYRNTKCCKHILDLLININWYANQMAMSIKSNMKNQKYF